MKTFEESSALQTRNAELIRQALPSMTEHVQRFLKELARKITPEMYAEILQMDTLLLTKVLVGLKSLSLEEQIKLPNLSEQELGNLLFSFATLSYHPISSYPAIEGATPAIESGASQLPRIREVINQEEGCWEYLFLKNAWLPDPNQQYQHNGYTYTFLREGPQGLFFSRQRSDKSANINRDFIEDQSLEAYFDKLLRNYGQNLIVKANDRLVVKHLISAYDYNKAGQKIFLFMEGIFAYSIKVAQANKDANAQANILADWQRLYIHWHNDPYWIPGKMPEPEHAPSQDLLGAADALLTEYHALKSSYSLPSYTVEVEESGNNAVVHRAQPDIEMVNGVPYVRIYQTVYAVSYGIKYKDIIQEADGKVKIINHGDKMWVNMGWPLRAFHYVRTYQAQGIKKRQEAIDKLNPNAADFNQKKAEAEFLHGLPVIRVFLISKDFHDEYTMSAISESQVDELGPNHTLNVDKAKAPNQYGVTTADEKMLMEHLLPGSLTSYVQDGQEWRYTDPRNGIVKSISILEKQLGLPTSDNPFMLDMNGTHVPNEDKQKENATRLAQLYDCTCLIKPYMEEIDMAQWADIVKTFSDVIDQWNQIASSYKVTFPTSPEEFYKVKSQIEQAATFSLIPSLIRENYEEARHRVHMDGFNQRTGERINLWTEMQHFTLVSYPAIRSAMPAKNALDEEIVRKQLGATSNQIIEVLIGYLNSDELSDRDFDMFTADVQDLLAYILYLATREHIHGKDVSEKDELAVYKKVLFKRVSSQVKRITELSTAVVVSYLKDLLDAILPSNLETIKTCVLGVVNQGVGVSAQRLSTMLQAGKVEHATIDTFLKGINECTSLDEAAFRRAQIQMLINLIGQEPKDTKGREYSNYQSSLAQKIDKIISPKPL